MRPAAAKTWMPWALLVLGTCGFLAAWLSLGFFNGRENSWMAVLAALDVALMLRLGRWRPGPWRAALAMLATAVIIVLAYWGLIAGQLGLMLGLSPWESSTRLGAEHAWTLAKLANGGWDWALLALSLPVAAVAAR